MRERVTDLFSPLRYRDFRYLWLAQVFSEIGDWAGRLALAVIVAEKTNSTFLTALVTTASVLPYIGIGQLTATYANRFPRRRVILVSDIGRAALFLALVIDMPVGVMLVIAFGAGCLTPMFESARGALTPLTVPQERFGDAIALSSITFDAALIFGYAAAGGLIVSIGPRAALAVNAGSFIISALLLVRIPAARQDVPGGESVRVFDGWRASVDDPFIRRFLVGWLWVGACTVVAESLVALYAIQVLHESAGISGLLAAAIPVGAVLATLFARNRGSHTEKLRRASELALAGSILGLIVFALDPGLPGILIGFAAIGVLNASRIPGNEVAVFRLEDRERGPWLALVNGFVLGSQAVAAATGGIVASSIGIREAIVVSLVVSGIVGLWGSLRPPHELRHAIRSSTTPR
jgi:MFS family permease